MLPVWYDLELFGRNFQRDFLRASGYATQNLVVESVESLKMYLVRHLGVSRDFSFGSYRFTLISVGTLGVL